MIMNAFNHDIITNLASVSFSLLDGHVYYIYHLLSCSFVCLFVYLGVAVRCSVVLVLCVNKMCVR